MRIRQRRSKSHLALNMTPLVDVVFLLIVFFIMTLNFSHLLIRKIDLPLADRAKPELNRTPDELIVTIQNDQSLFIGHKPVPLQRLGEMLQKRVNNADRTTVTLRGDGNLPYQITGRSGHRSTSSFQGHHRRIR